MACFAVGLAACSNDGQEPVPPNTTSDCAALEPGQVTTLDAEVHVLANGYALGRAAGSLARALLPDRGDVYWYDDDDSLFVERQGDGRAIELGRAEPPRGAEHEAALGLAANRDRLFVGYAERPPSDIFTIEPPGRLLSVSKQDGQWEVLLELKDYWMTPIAADDERVILFAVGVRDDGFFDVGFYQVPLAAPRLEPLPLSRSIAPGTDSSMMARAMLAPFDGGQLIDDEVYWASYDAPWGLLRASVDDAEPEVLRPVPEYFFFAAGPGYILTQEDVFLPNRYYDGKDLVLRDEAGCRYVPGSRGGAVNAPALDVKFAYWTGGAAGQLAPSGDGIGLTRLDVQSGALTRLNALGLTSASNWQIVGHDDSRLFLYDGDSLVSLQKP